MKSIVKKIIIGSSIILISGPVLLALIALIIGVGGPLLGAFFWLVITGGALTIGLCAAGLGLIVALFTTISSIIVAAIGVCFALSIIPAVYLSANLYFVVLIIACLLIAKLIRQDNQKPV